MTNVGLAHVAKDYKLPVQKLIGDLDYYVMRTPKTDNITINEFAYMENDVLVIHEYIKIISAKYERLSDIPYTQTGFVRAAVRTEQGDKLNHINARRNETDVYTFRMLNKCFCGGYTHANVRHANKIINDVVSYDFSSSYPYVMLSEKYPMERFQHGGAQSLEVIMTADYYKELACIIDVTFYGYECLTNNTYISASKCVYLQGAELDNGRVLSADVMRVVLTDVDLTYFYKTAYFKSYIINDFMSARKNYLPRPLWEYVLKLYQDKTTLKGVEEEYSVYMTQKQRLNSCYGMCVTNNIKPEITFENGNWEYEAFTEVDMQEKLLDNVKYGFLNYAWGVWVTAYARRNLWTAIYALDPKIIYCDTDSIKTFNDQSVHDFVEEYNKSVADKLQAAADYYGGEYDFAPKDIRGRSHLIGAFDFDGHYDEFKTLGAKKYACKADGEIHITVAGVPKSYSKYLKSLEEFNDGLVFEPIAPKYTDGADISKKIAHYADEPVTLYFPCADGSGVFECTSAVCLQPTSYSLSLDKKYKSLCEIMAGK